MAVFPALASDKVRLDSFAIDRHEVSIARLAAFTQATGRITAAEANGGGHEWDGGWQRRKDWHFRQPFGVPGASSDLPAVHVSWHEARDFCQWAGGRLPTRAEWTRAAYTEQLGQAGYVIGRTDPYPTGDSPSGAKTNGADPWPNLAPVGATRRGVNGLYDMGSMRGGGSPTGTATPR